MILHLKNKIITLHHKIEVFDENDQLEYEVASKMISITDKTILTDAKKNEVAKIHRKPVSIHEIYYVEMNDGTNFEIRTELLHVGVEVMKIDALGLSILGNFLEHNYNIEDENGTVLASCAKKWIAVHELYTLDIQDESKKDLLVAIYVVLEHILVHREQNNMNATASTMPGNK